MALLLGEEVDIEVIGEAGDGEQAIAQARALQPDVVVMDINMCKRVGLVNTEGTSRYLRANADLHSYRLDDALQGFQHAAKKRSIMHRKVAIDAQVGLVLTYQALQRSEDAVETMKQLMEFALDTEDPQHIAVAQSCQARLFVSPGTVKGHLKNLYQKLDVHTRHEAVLKAAEIEAASHGVDQSDSQ